MTALFKYHLCLFTMTIFMQSVGDYVKAIFNCETNYLPTNKCH